MQNVFVSIELLLKTDLGSNLIARGRLVWKTTTPKEDRVKCRGNIYIQRGHRHINIIKTFVQVDMHSLLWNSINVVMPVAQSHSCCLT